jgi:hypothetical protein
MSQPDGGAVWQHNDEFFNLDEATDFGLAHAGRRNSVDESDGFRIYLDGVLKRTLSIRSDTRDEP